MASPFGAKPGSVASRFISQSEITEAQERRQQELKATYARLGQEPPKEEEYDPRSLFERLQANKEAKQEKFDALFKPSNLYRGIDEAESEFLADVAKEKRDEERRKKEDENRELEEFRRATQAKAESPSNPLGILTKTASTSQTNPSPSSPSEIRNQEALPLSSSPPPTDPSLKLDPSSSSSKLKPNHKRKRKEAPFLGVVRRKKESVERQDSSNTNSIGPGDNSKEDPLSTPSSIDRRESTDRGGGAKRKEELKVDHQPVRDEVSNSGGGDSSTTPSLDEGKRKEGQESKKGILVVDYGDESDEENVED
ncbi:hypothetical protein IE53DRAFT_388528 [Violaceomyces palustris]|uniref:Uncharacterized protein n=1 Tax=Violaceomyces palustris TaxID=1673888 RepID=A0ACD0NU04_9BASI|nr:hypothetical protein IE53DRAFT_388528 [Violaceomyces palustris]